MGAESIALGVDVGGTQIKAALVDEAGQVVRAEKARTPTSLDELRLALADLLANVSRGVALRGAGVACKGIIDSGSTQVVCQPGVMRYIEGLVLSDLIGEALRARIPVFADNDARVALVGECVWGAARGRRNVLMFTLGTGVGGAILSDGRIVRGHGGVAGHLGHVTIDPDGPPCICGNRGCLEAFFSARVVEAEAFSAIHRGVVASFANADGPPTCAQVFDAAIAGDEAATWIVGNGVRKLGAAIAGLIHALDPEVVIIGGQVAGAGEILFAPLRDEISWRTRGLLKREVPVVPVQVPDPSGVIGAAALVYGVRL